MRKQTQSPISVSTGLEDEEEEKDAACDGLLGLFDRLPRVERPGLNRRMMLFKPGSCFMPEPLFSQIPE